MTLKRTTVYLSMATLVFALACTVPIKERGCERFRNGRFVFHHKEKGLKFGDNIIIERRDSIQIEKDSETGKYAKLSVVWTDPCNYELRLIETTFDIPDSIQQLNKTIPFMNEIISTSNHFYVCKTFWRNSIVVNDTLWTAN